MIDDKKFFEDLRMTTEMLVEYYGELNKIIEEAIEELSKLFINGDSDVAPIGVMDSSTISARAYGAPDINYWPDLYVERGYPVGSELYKNKGSGPEIKIDLFNKVKFKPEYHRRCPCSRSGFKHMTIMNREGLI